jgi:anti-anti-sigma factor
MTGSFDETVEFRMREVFDGPDTLRLVLSGELDLAVAAILGERLRHLRTAGFDVRLDLAELDFIDSSGLRELITALAESRSDGWRLDIDPQVSEAVRRTVDLAGLHAHFWPDRR